ncbi:MAG: hypothetical protein OEL84_00810 [Nitrosopumilus sp.]|nr:hypothetical protein [Nitrosopumilus sp.]
MPTILLDDTQERRLKLLDIVNQFREKGKLVNRYTLQPALEEQGYKVSFATIYRDMTSINQKNTWVRDLAQSNYSAYQESISQNLEWIEQQAQKMFQETENHVWLNIIHRVQETKMKHTNGENINISAAMLGKKFNEMKKEDEQECVVDVIKLASKKT